MVEALAGLGVDDLDNVAARCRATRNRLGLPTGRWTTRVLTDVLARAVLDCGWPPETAVAALLTVAADPTTRSPARLCCPGPWWDSVTNQATGLPDDRTELAAWEARLAEADGLRVWAQRTARDQLAGEGNPITRLTVARRACALLERRSFSQNAL
jgi:hypothetical protein